MFKNLLLLGVFGAAAVACHRALRSPAARPTPAELLRRFMDLEGFDPEAVVATMPVELPPAPPSVVTVPPPPAPVRRAAPYHAPYSLN